MSDDSAVLVCSTVGFYPDDVRGVCADCGGAVVWRPHAPADAKRLCITCFLGQVHVMSRQQRAELTITATPEALVEAETLAKRRLF